MDPFEAAVHAARSRLRPILMTSFAFIFGVIPLVIAVGPGAEMRQAMGTAVAFGMLGVTLFGLIFTPVFYVVCRGSAAGCRSGRSATRITRPHSAASPRAGAGSGGMKRAACRVAGRAGAGRLHGRARLSARRPPARRPRTRSSAAGRPPSPATSRRAAGGACSTIPCSTGWSSRRSPANTDLRVAAANLRRARAVLRETRSGLFPTADRSCERHLQPAVGRPARLPRRRRRGRELRCRDRRQLPDRPVRPHPPRHPGEPRRCRRRARPRSTSAGSPSRRRRRALMPTPAAPAASSPSRARRLRIQEQTFDLTRRLMEGGRGTALETSQAGLAARTGARERADARGAARRRPCSACRC